MKLFHGARFQAEKSWTGPLVAEIKDALVKLRWTKDPFVWHANTGDEVFVVLDGVVNMHVREKGEERVVRLERGDVFHVSNGDEHVAHPDGIARVLVVEERESP